MLARYGYEVTVCESHYALGGAAHSFEVKGHHFDSGPSFFAGLSGELADLVLVSSAWSQKVRSKLLMHVNTDLDARLNALLSASAITLTVLPVKLVTEPRQKWGTKCHVAKNTIVAFVMHQAKATLPTPSSRCSMQLESKLTAQCMTE